MADFAVHTHIDIDADASVVWGVVESYRAYDEWNPFMTRVRVDSARGTIDFVAHLAGREVPISARVLRLDPGRAIRWRGPRSALLGAVFHGEHFLEVEPLGPGRARFVHGEQFGGLAIAPLWPRLGPALLRAYDSMNEALRARAERLAGRR